jgi:hypothetical protein
MLRRGREQRTGMEKGLRPLLQTWCKRKNSFAFRNNKKKKNQQENNQNKPKQTTEYKKKTTRKVDVALFVVRMIIGQVRAQTANLSKRRKQPTW